MQTTPRRDGTFDGAWWPRSRNLETQLPGYARADRAPGPPRPYRPGRRRPGRAHAPRDRRRSHGPHRLVRRSAGPPWTTARC
ncbi:DUF5994 family protein [Streptomyces roseoverticillatus]|uniref:DUF5994 family protein n=1 Tax=Streptomyces roseoverticillatus TaxID=66429 RepID=UPI0033E1E489